MDILMALRKIRGCEGEVAAQLVLEYAIKEAVEAEREACAKACDKAAQEFQARSLSDDETQVGRDAWRDKRDGAKECAHRMRSNANVTGLAPGKDDK